MKMCFGSVVKMCFGVALEGGLKGRVGVFLLDTLKMLLPLARTPTLPTQSIFSVF